MVVLKKILMKIIKTSKLIGYKSYKVGKDFEEQIIDYYADRDYFVFKVPTVIQGTVFDIIVIKGGTTLCIECKHTNSAKLNFIGSGLAKKEDEITHFVKKTNTNIYFYIKSEKLNGIYWTTYKRSWELLKKQGYLDLEKDCFKATI